MTSSLETLWKVARILGSRRPGRKGLPSLLFFTDPVRTPFPEETIAKLPRGAGVVYRAFGARDAQPVGRRLAALCHRRGLVFLVGADVSLAVAVRADGIHWPERMAFRSGRNRRLNKRFLLTAAAHGPVSLRLARHASLAALVISPVFPSSSPSAGKPLGARRFAAMARSSVAPVYALGGVNAGTVRQLIRCGGAGFAAVEGLSRARGNAPVGELAARFGAHPPECDRSGPGLSRAVRT
jgi:thiamine-phosphate pyrophosphorylase